MWRDKHRGRYPIVWHRFRDLDEALDASAFGEGFAILCLPAPAFPVRDTVSVRFRVGGGQFREALGQGAIAGGLLRVRFQGQQAEVVREAIDALAYPYRPRAHVRYRCWMRLTLETAPSEAVYATACDIGEGGARLTALSGELQPDAEVRVRISGEQDLILARVLWYLPQAQGGAAGLVFSGEPSNLALVRRLVSEAAAHVSERRATS